MTDNQKLVHSFRVSGGPNYRLVPTSGDVVKLEVNRIESGKFPTRSAAMNAAVTHYERSSKVRPSVITNMQNISYWSEGIVIVGSDDR